MRLKTFTELDRLKTFQDRYEYLRLGGAVGRATFGYDRYMNQLLYTSRRWKQVRDEVIIRDQGCDLGDSDYEIRGKILIHHMNAITAEDIALERDEVFDPEFLICTTLQTHNAIHYGDESLLPQLPVERRRNDTCPWV